MPTLYDIDAELDALSRQIADAEGEVDDATSERFDALLDAREDKADAYIALIKNAEAEAGMFDGEIARLQSRQKASKNLAARLKDRLLTSMQASGDEVIEGHLGRIRRQRSSSRSVVVLADPGDLPERFQRVSVSADKTALKAALAEQDEEAVRFAEMAESSTEYVRIY